LDGQPAELLMLPCAPEDPRKKELEYLKIYMTAEERTWLRELKLSWGSEGLTLAGQREKIEAVNARALIRNAMATAPSWAPDVTALLCAPALAPSPEALVLQTPLLQIHNNNFDSILVNHTQGIEKQLRIQKKRAQKLTKVCVRLLTPH
jgi:hypothetical protein